MAGRANLRATVAVVVALATALLAFAVSALLVRGGLDSITQADDIARSAESLRADVNELAAIENSAEAEGSVDDDVLLAAADRAQEHLIALIPAIEEAQRDGFRSRVQAYVDASTQTASAFAAGDDGAEQTDYWVTEPLYELIVSELIDLREEWIAASGRARDDVRRGFVVGGVAIMLGTLGVWSVDARRRSRAAHLAATESAGRRLRALMDDSTDHVYVIDREGAITFMSPAAIRFMGRRCAHVSELRSTLDLDTKQSLDALRAEHDDGVGEVHTTSDDGRRVYFRVRVAERFGVDGLDGLVVSARDVTEEVRLREELARQADEDELTGLPNRRTFTRLLEEAFDLDDPQVGLLLIDLDGFKGVNDSLGHPVGDDLLRCVADRLAATTRSNESVVRLGGDEFAVVARHSDPGRLIATAERLIEVISEPVETGRDVIEITASVGVATSRDAGTADDLFRFADIALYDAKNSGRRRAALFAVEAPSDDESSPQGSPSVMSGIAHP